MNAGVALSQNIRPEQTLAPQLRQSLKMLQMTVPELNAELRAQMEQNPMIEDVERPQERPMSEALPQEHTSEAVTERELDFTPDGRAAENVLGADDGYRDYFLGNLENAPGDEEARSRRDRMFDSLVRADTLQDHLLAQIPLSSLPPEDHALARHLIGGIDDDGYFKSALPDVEMVTGADETRILSTLARIREFDPPGCGARDLRECLLAQMGKLDDSPWEDEVRALIDRHLPDIAARREGAICRDLNLSPDDYRRALAELRTLDPRPGRAFRPPAPPNAPPPDLRALYVKPEVFTVRKDGAWTAVVPGRDLPDIKISPRYEAMLRDPRLSAEAKAYLEERKRAAQALIDAIAHRQTTIRDIAQAIIDAQPGVFSTGSLDALRPLTMQQVADAVGVHGTTVSRTVRGKYMATPAGVVELRRFFTGGLATESGEAVSNVSVKNAVRDLIAAEDASAPLSDERIAAVLKARGIDIARRTVAKYRIALGIPGTAERKVKR